MLQQSVNYTEQITNIIYMQALPIPFREQPLVRNIR